MKTFQLSCLPALFAGAVISLIAPPAIAIENTVSSDADFLAQALFPGGDGLVFTAGNASLDFGLVVDDFLDDGDFGDGDFGDGDFELSFATSTLDDGELGPGGPPVPSDPFDSIGTFVNPAGTFGIGGGGNPVAQGIVISSGSVLDFETGPNTSGSTTSTFGSTATDAQNALLSEITGQPVHFDTTTLTIRFENETDGNVNLNLFAVFGTEETPDFVGTGFNDGFGVFLNGVNIAQSGGLPLNVDHPGQLPFFGTELDSVIAVPTDKAGFDPRINLSTEVGPGENELVVILGDASDSVLDSTAFLSRIQIPGPSPGAPLLPNNTPQPGEPFKFDGINAEAGDQVVIDPAIAIGYVYDAFQEGGEEPLFASVIANPAGDDTVFTVNFNGQSETLVAGEEFFFDTPVETFSITDIDPAESLPSDDPQAFLTVVTFSEAVTNATITQLAITVPEPSTLVILAGLVVPWMLRRK